MNKVWIVCALSLIGCGGRISEENDGAGSHLMGQAGQADESSQPSPAAPAAEADAAPSSPGAVTTTEGGACQVNVLVGAPGGYDVGLTEKGGSTRLEATGGRYHITCTVDGKTRVSVWTSSIAEGDQPIAAGELVLEGRVSDRACTVRLFHSDSPPASPRTLTGFFSCPHEPFVESSLFSYSDAPLGLGAFDVALP